MNKIQCRKCLYENNKTESCSECGGYGYMAGKVKCTSCVKWGYFRPGAFTMYEGKRYTSLDGLTFVYHENGGPNCVYCEQTKLEFIAKKDREKEEIERKRVKMMALREEIENAVNMNA